MLDGETLKNKQANMMRKNLVFTTLLKLPMKKLLLPPTDFASQYKSN